MYRSKNIKGAVSIGNFIRDEKGAEIFYEVTAGTVTQAMKSLQAHVTRSKAKTTMQRLILVNPRSLETIELIKVILVKPAPPKLRNRA